MFDMIFNAIKMIKYRLFIIFGVCLLMFVVLKLTFTIPLYITLFLFMVSIKIYQEEKKDTVISNGNGNHIFDGEVIDFVYLVICLLFSTIISLLSWFSWYLIIK
jgi:hypothetical protein